MSTSSGKIAEKENESRKTNTPGKDTIADSNSTGDRNGSNSSASKRPLGSSNNSTFVPSDVKKSVTSTPKNDEERIVGYVKYDKLPESWIEREWWTRPSFDKTQPMLTLHKPINGIDFLEENTRKKAMELSTSEKNKTLAPVPIQSSNEYVQFIQAFQNFVHRLNKLDTNKFEGLVTHVDLIAKKLQAGGKDKTLSLYVVRMDTFIYKTFCCMKPFQFCNEDAVYVRYFFESFKSSIAAHFFSDDRTKRDMMEILNTQITALRIYGEKMVIPCHLIVKQLTDFATLLMEEYPKI